MSAVVTEGRTAGRGRGLSRRNMLRFAAAAVPAGAGLLWAGTANASIAPIAPAAAPLAQGAADNYIEIIDAVSKSVATRASLVPGNYKPDASTTGPVPGTALRRIDGDFAATANGQVIENLEIYGTLNLKSYSNVIVRNCVIWGTMATGVDTAFIIFANDNGRGALIEDCRLNGRGNVWVSGVRGGNYTIRRTEITNAPDGICLTSQLGNVTVEGCWIHNGFFAEWDATTKNMPYAGSYYTHVDGVQFHRGKNYVFRGNVIGGKRFVANHHTDNAANINAADDMYNSAFMIKQEVDNTVANRVENVLIENNWLAGGVSTINICSGRDNTFATTTIRNNKFMRSTWGSQMYILRGPNLGNFSNNTFEDDGSAVPFSKGA